MKRRYFLSLLGIGMMPLKRAVARAPRPTLLSAPLELGGNWRGSARADAAMVIERMRTACLAGVALRSDQQPEKLRVDDRPSGYPSVWLQTAAPTTAWIFVNVGVRAWSNLAYQMGHELGHVFCNSWGPDAKPRNPCQWVEEALVEAFSLRGLSRLAVDWARAPPFPNDAAYASSIQDYRESALVRYRTIARDQGIELGFGAWFKAHEVFLSKNGGLDDANGAVSTMLDVLEEDAAMIEDMAALNRWPGRSGVPLHDYLNFWQKSCAELNTSGRLPTRIQELLALP